MAPNPKSVQRLIADLGLDQSRTGALRKDWWSYMESIFGTKQAAAERLQSDSVRQTHVNKFLESSAGEKWFQKEGGLCVEPKPMATLRVGLFDLVKQWMTNLKHNEAKPQKRVDDQKASEAAREVRRAEKKRQKKPTSDRPENNTPVFIDSDDEDDRDHRPRPPKLSSTTTRGHRSRQGSPELPDLSELINQTQRVRSSSTVWSPQISPDATDRDQASSSLIVNKSPNISDALTGSSAKNASNATDLPTPPTSGHKRKRSTALDLVDAQGPSEEAANTEKTPKRRARFAAPVVMPSDGSDSSTNMAAETGTNEVISAIMSGALPLIETSPSLQTAATPRPLAGNNDPFPDDQRTISDATDAAMDGIHVPWSEKSGGDSIQMSLESLRRLPAKLLDFIQETETYYSKKANDRDAGRPDRERHTIREKLLHDLKKDLKSLMRRGQGGKQDEAAHYISWAKCY